MALVWTMRGFAALSVLAAVVTTLLAHSLPTELADLVGNDGSGEAIMVAIPTAAVLLATAEILAIQIKRTN